MTTSASGRTFSNSEFGPSLSLVTSSSWPSFYTIGYRLIHVPKRMPVSFDTLHDARGQKVLRRRAIKDPICFIGEIGETCAFAHVEANGGLFYVDVKIVFWHRFNFPGLTTKLVPEAFGLEPHRPIGFSGIAYRFPSSVFFGDAGDSRPAALCC
jgi:hypothetical protein